MEKNIYHRKYIKYKTKYNMLSKENDIQPAKRINMHPSKVESEKDLIKFISYLHKDFLNKREGWKNITIEGFLEAIVAGYEDHQEGDYLKTENIWTKVAKIIDLGRFYE